MESIKFLKKLSTKSDRVGKKRELLTSSESRNNIKTIPKTVRKNSRSMKTAGSAIKKIAIWNIFRRKLRRDLVGKKVGVKN